MSIAVVCLAVAIAGPRTGDSTTQVFAEGIAIMLVVDRSGSMDARDFVADDSSVTRLDAVKQVLRQFVLGQRQPTRATLRPYRFDYLWYLRRWRFATHLGPWQSHKRSG